MPIAGIFLSESRHDDKITCELSVCHTSRSAHSNGCILTVDIQHSYVTTSCQ
jgi:hypothetical protein